MSKALASGSLMKQPKEQLLKPGLKRNFLQSKDTASLVNLGYERARRIIHSLNRVGGSLDSEASLRSTETGKSENAHAETTNLFEER